MHNIKTNFSAFDPLEDRMQNDASHGTFWVFVSSTSLSVPENSKNESNFVL